MSFDGTVDGTLEEALQALERIVSQLESGETSLDEAMQLFERGQALLNRCQRDLEAKELRVQQIMADSSRAPLER